jgi:hypothetical protein
MTPSSPSMLHFSNHTFSHHIYQITLSIITLFTSRFSHFLRPSDFSPPVTPLAEQVQRAATAAVPPPPLPPLQAILSSLQTTPTAALPEPISPPLPPPPPPFHTHGSPSPAPHSSPASASASLEQQQQQQHKPNISPTLQGLNKLRSRDAYLNIDRYFRGGEIYASVCLSA